MEEQSQKISLRGQESLYRNDCQDLSMINPYRKEGFRYWFDDIEMSTPSSGGIPIAKFIQFPDWH